MLKKTKKQDNNFITSLNTSSKSSLTLTSKYSSSENYADVADADQNGVTMNNQVQIGGKVIGKGGFGCVVSPSIKCSKKDKNTNQMVSKIVRSSDPSYSNELKISQILRKIDSSKKYYITFDKYCYINEPISDRTDIVNVHYINDELTKWKVTKGQENKDNDACDIELTHKPLNLIMEYGGYSLSNIQRVNQRLQGTKAKMHQLFIDNLGLYMKHLILGIVKMHFNRIVNRDIKPHNIMMNFNKETGRVQIRYIDFGLSDFLNNDFCDNEDNIINKGTKKYISPDLYIAYVIIRYKDRSNVYKIQKIIKYLDSNFKYSITSINQRELIGNYTENVNLLYRKLLELHEQGKLLSSYFGTERNKFNGYLQKGDIYALGLTIYNFLYLNSDIDVQKNNNLYDLLIHMIAMDPDKRYNAVKCLAHPFLQSIDKKQ